MDKKMTKTELEIMEFLWDEKKEKSVAEIINYFNNEKAKDWKKQTVTSFLKYLKNKGYLNYNKIGRHIYYSPSITRADYERLCAKEILDNHYEGRLQNFIAALSGNDHISASEVEDLIERIQNGDL